jgi:hypothetical protein
MELSPASFHLNSDMFRVTTTKINKISTVFRHILSSLERNLAIYSVVGVPVLSSSSRHDMPSGFAKARVYLIQIFNRAGSSCEKLGFRFLNQG